MTKTLHQLSLTASRSPAVLAALMTALGVLVLSYAALFWGLPADQWDPDLNTTILLTTSSVWKIIMVAHQAGAPATFAALARAHDGNVIFAILDYVGNILRYPETFSTTLLKRVVEADIAFQLPLRVIGIFGSGIAAAWPVYRHVLAKTPKTRSARHVEGPTTLWFGAAVGAARTHLNNLLRLFGEGIELAPNLRMPRTAEYESLLAIGLPAAGKTVIIEGLYRQAIERGDRICCLDVKGGLARRIAMLIGWTRLAVIGIGGGAWVWAVGRDVTSEDRARALSAILIPESNDPVWSSASRLLFTAILLKLMQDFGMKWGWKALQDTMSRSVEQLAADVASVMPAVTQLLRGKSEDPTTAVLSVFFNMIAHVSEIVDTFAAMEVQGRPNLSLVRWALGKSARPVLVLTHDLSKRNSSRVVLTAMIRLLAAELLGPRVTPNVDHRIWIGLDEITRLGNKIDELEDLAALGRDRGIRVLATAQSIAQLRQEYGKDGADAITENFRTVIVCQARPGRNANDLIETVIPETTFAVTKPGKPADEELHKVPALTSHQLSTELGLKFDLYGAKSIRAAMVGLDNVYVFEWPLDTWKRL